MFQLQNGGFPTTAMGLKALRTASHAPNYTPYLAGPIPNDPWGRPYRYEYPGKHGRDKPDLWSLGPDGASGTDDDIGNWSDR